MTKQEEIREMVEQLFCTNCKMAGGIECKESCNMDKSVTEFLNDLDSKDVAIKAEGELPELFQHQGLHNEFWKKDLKRRLDKVGYTAWKPLIEKT